MVSMLLNVVLGTKVGTASSDPDVVSTAPSSAMMDCSSWYLQENG